MFGKFLLLFAMLCGWSLKAHLLRQGVFSCFDQTQNKPLFVSWSQLQSSLSDEPTSLIIWDVFTLAVSTKPEAHTTRSCTFPLQAWWRGCHSDKTAAFSVSHSGGKRNSQGDGSSLQLTLQLFALIFTLYSPVPRPKEGFSLGLFRQVGDG